GGPMSTDDTVQQPRGIDGDLPTVLVDQIDVHVTQFLRPRLEGLTDQEYFFDPTGHGTAWTVHPRRPDDPARPRAIQAGAGDMVVDFELPEPQPAPVTTIAWRLAHIVVGILGARSQTHLGGPQADYVSWEYAA